MILIQIKGLVKTLYLPVVLASMFELYKYEKVKINTTYLIYALTGYSFIIVFAKYFDIGYASYVYGGKLGTVGLFYAANEIGAILAILTPYIFIKKLNNENNTFCTIAYILLICSVLELGTKVPFLAFSILLFLDIIIIAYKRIISKEKEYNKKICASLLITLFIICIIGITPVGKNLDISFININQNISDNNINNSTKDNNASSDLSDTTIGTFSGDITSGRTGFLKTNYKEYANNKWTTILFGTSYLKVDGGEVVEKKLVEMDFCDIFINHGIIGFILILGPMLIMTVIVIFKNLKQFTKLLKEPERLYYLYAYFIGLAVSFLSGHVLTSPAVSIYIIIALILNMQIIDDKKIEG